MFSTTLPHLVSLFALASIASAQVDCSGTPIGSIPLSDLGTDTYQGFPGGLYSGGSNVIPAAHQQSGINLAQNVITPLDAAGNPDSAGRVVLVSVGMSNTSQEFNTFLQLSNADPDRDSSVTVVNGAQSGQDAVRVADPDGGYWDTLDDRLSQAGVTPAQVQVVWLKEAVSHPTLPFPAHATELRDLLGAITRNVLLHYPNTKICYVSSRIYAGYAPPTSQNPEPYAYESGLSVKWLIEQQIDGDPSLNWDAAVGPVVAPWLAWGPYMWADGLTPRSDGLTWECSDYSSDGTHPGQTGQQKVAQMLDAHFHNDPTATPWYLGTGGGGHPPAAMVDYGVGCDGAHGVPQNRWNSLPFVGNSNFRVGVQSAVANSPVAMLLATAGASLPLGGTCTLLVDSTGIIASLGSNSDQSGRTAHTMAIPSDLGLAGVSIFAQNLVVDSAGTLVLGVVDLAMTAGVQWQIGV